MLTWTGFPTVAGAVALGERADDEDVLGAGLSRCAGE